MHRHRAILLAVLSIFAALGSVNAQQLQIHTINVGQGASELIIGPNGTTILLDGGTRGKGSSEVIPYLNAIFPAGSRHLEYMIASHDDGDHYGGLGSVLAGGYTAGTIYHCGNNAGFGMGVKIPLGLVIDLGNGARATCVGRYGDFIDGSQGGTSDNNQSICLLIEYGVFDYITAGDLETGENYLSAALIGYPPGHPYLDPAYGVDVIHANHHGSDGSSKNYYVNRLKHELALINGGTGYGHPRWTAVDRLKGRPYYSDGSGATGVTWTGCANVYRTTYDVEEDGRAPEWDCPTLGDMVITYDGVSRYYYLNGTSYSVDEPLSGAPTPSVTPTARPTVTPIPSATPSVTPTIIPTPSVAPTSSPAPSPTLTPWVDWNQSFENWVTVTSPEKWTVDDGWARQTEDARHGDYAAVFTTTDDHVFASQALPKDAPRFMELGVWVKMLADDGRKCRVAYEYQNGPGGPRNRLEGNTVTSSTEWATSSFRVERGEGWLNEWITISCFYCPAGGDLAIFDAVWIRDYAVSPTPTGTPTAVPTPSATITPALSATPTPTPNITPTPRLPPTPSPSPTCGPSIAPDRNVISSGDYDGDGAAEVAIFRPSGGLWSVKDLTRMYFGGSVDHPASGDYDGDGTAEVVVFRPAQGLWSVKDITRAYFGGSTDLPAPGDYDGDGSCDIGIFRENGGMWSIRNLTRFYFGATSDWPLPGDWGGNGTVEAGLYRPSGGQWMVRNLTRFYLGSSSDWPIPGDYKGERTWSGGIFRPCSGMWAIRDITRIFFGNCFDHPVPADYDGGGTTDIGIFRDSAGLWSIRNLSRVYFGGTGDIPVTR